MLRHFPAYFTFLSVCSYDFGLWALWLSFYYSIYTWCRPTLTPILKHLDLVLVNPEWNAFFDSTAIEHLYRTLSNHSPLFISSKFYNGPRGSGIKFQTMWTNHHSFMGMVRSPWQHSFSGLGLHILASKLIALKSSLKAWNYSVLGILRVIFLVVKNMSLLLSLLTMPIPILLTGNIFKNPGPLILVILKMYVPFGNKSLVSNGFLRVMLILPFFMLIVIMGGIIFIFLKLRMFPRLSLILKMLLNVKQSDFSLISFMMISQPIYDLLLQFLSMFRILLLPLIIWC